MRIEQAAAIRQQARQVLLEPPDLAFGAAAEFWRIENDPVVALAAPHFARSKLGRIIDDPAQRALRDPRKFGIGAGLRDRFLAGIDMGDRAEPAQRLGADAGVSE